VTLNETRFTQVNAFLDKHTAQGFISGFVPFNNLINLTVRIAAHR
jgi:hypothetical protein